MPSEQPDRQANPQAGILPGQPLSETRTGLPSFSVFTLGCKVNQYESEAIAEQLRRSGWQDTAEGGSASLCVINTCSVTGRASMQSRQAIRQMQRKHPQARVVVTGCYAQTAPEELVRIPGIHHLVDNVHKPSIPQLLTVPHTGCAPVVLHDDIALQRQFQGPTHTVLGRRARPFLKIQDGCDAFCTYCIVPYARGRSRSMPVEEVLRHLEVLQEMGYHEVVLTGIHLGRWGRDLSPPWDLYRLLRAVDETCTLERIRLSSLEPDEVPSELLALMASSRRICPHLHLPLQSGDDDVLAAMHRPYTGRLFEELVHHIRGLLPNCAVGADILVGFPGETHRAFESTWRLVEALPLSYLHVFPFSPRKGTPASGYRGQIDPQTIKARSARMRALGAAKRAAFYRSMVGRTEQIIVEGKWEGPGDRWKGLTANYVPVCFPCPGHAPGALAEATLLEAPPHSPVTGKLLP